jgi:cell wall-associated NlpC family hydrolase
MIKRIALTLNLLLCAAAPLHAAPDQPPAADAGAMGHWLPAQADATPLVQQVREAALSLVGSSMDFLGVPYRRGGSTPQEGFDCSGFTRHVFENSVGLLLPRRANEQARDATLAPVKRDELQPGDLVFFNTLRRAFSHVGIYVGDGEFIHAPRRGAKVRIESMRQPYWAKRFNGARRADMPLPKDGPPR